MKYWLTDIQSDYESNTKSVTEHQWFTNLAAN